MHLENHCIETDIAVCAIQLNIFNKKFFILTIYRSPIENFSNFITRLEQILQTYNYKLDLVICGDLKINSLEESIILKNLNTLLKTCDISILILFSDDTSVLISSKNPEELDLKLNMVLQIINNWFVSNLLSINVQKTQCVQFTTKNPTTIGNKVQVNPNKIIEIPHIKFLGLEIDKILTWNLHIDTIINKLTSVCFMLRTVKPYTSPSSLKTLYYSLFHSVLTYGIIFWGQLSNSQRLFILQRRAIRIITGQGNRISCRPFFE
jgi:hypothetical protein